MARLTEEDKIKINEIYLKVGTYAETARQTGFSPATVKKYVIKDFKPQSEIKIKVFKEEEIPSQVDLTPFIQSENWGEFCILSEKEKEEMKELWKELLL